MAAPLTRTVIFFKSILMIFGFYVKMLQKILTHQKLSMTVSKSYIIIEVVFVNVFYITTCDQFCDHIISLWSNLLLWKFLKSSVAKIQYTTIQDTRYNIYVSLFLEDKNALFKETKKNFHIFFYYCL